MILLMILSMITRTDNDRMDHMKKNMTMMIGRDDLNQEAQEEQNLDREMLSPKRITILNSFLSRGLID